MTTLKTNIEKIAQKFSVSKNEIITKQCDITNCVYFKIISDNELYTVAYYSISNNTFNFTA